MSRGIFLLLPNLRRVTLTDFRSLATPGEDYNTLCDCLFGRNLEPDLLTYFEFPFERGLVALFDTVSRIPGASIQRLCVGGHHFDVSANHYRGSHDLRRYTRDTNIDGLPHKPPSLQATVLPVDLRDEGRKYNRAFNKLQQLRLPVAVAVDLRSGESFISKYRMQQSLGRKLVTHSEDTLVDLSLAALDILVYEGNGFKTPWPDGIDCIDQLLLDLTFPSLRST